MDPYLKRKDLIVKLNHYERKIRKLEESILKKSGIYVTINDDINMSEISDMTSVEGGTEIEDNYMVSNENVTRTISTRNSREGSIGNHDKKKSEAQLRPSQKEKATKALEVELVPSANLEATRRNENITRTIPTRNIREGNIGNHDRKK